MVMEKNLVPKRYCTQSHSWLKDVFIPPYDKNIGNEKPIPMVLKNGSFFSHPQMIGTLW